MAKTKTIQDMRALGKLGGRPGLGDQVSVGVFATERGRDVLMLRIGHTLARRLGWRVGTLLRLSLPGAGKVLNVTRVFDDGLPLRKAPTGKTLLLQQTVTGVLPPFPTVKIMPIVLEGHLSIPLKTALTS